VADYYFDASAVVKKYVLEAGSEFVADVLRFEARHRAYMSDVGAGLARRGRDGAGVLSSFADAIRAFHSDFDTRWRIVPTTRRLLLRARDLAVRHFLRGYDAVHLAAAVESSRIVEEVRGEGIILVSSDDLLNVAARAEGLRVIDPTRSDETP
jgi:predicted nucleic acid-binding protein